MTLNTLLLTPFMLLGPSAFDKALLAGRAELQPPLFSARARSGFPGSRVVMYRVCQNRRYPPKTILELPTTEALHTPHLGISGNL